MKITQQMISAFTKAVWLDDSPAAYRELDSDEIKAGLAAALRDMPDVVPFAFDGYPDNPVYLHPACGAVVDVSSLGIGASFEQVDRDECDCENTSPWLRIYVEREA